MNEPQGWKRNTCDIAAKHFYHFRYLESMAARLLVVDDEPDITTVLKAGLEKEGFAVEAFNHPLKALENFTPGAYDMVMLDVRMPDIDGFTL